MSDPQYPQYPDHDKKPEGTPPSPDHGSTPPPPPPPYGQQPLPPYGQPQAHPAAWGYGYAAPATNQMAVWAMVLGIISIVFCYVGLIIGPVAIGLAVSARRQINDSRGAQTGGGMAVAGLVTGIVGTVIWAGFIALIVIGLSVGA